MKNSIVLLLLISVLAACQRSGSTTSSDSIDIKVDSILSQLSLKEKIGQMTQLNLDVISVGEIFALEEPHQLDTAKLRKAIVEYGVGSILNVGGHAYSLEHWQAIIKTIQNMALEETQAKIPVLYGIDAIHGAGYLLNGTLFPQPLAQAATFNPTLVEHGAAITAYETRACGIPWNFSPVLDVARQPLWSRVFETYGEDVLVCKTMGTAAIRGYQGNDPGDPERLAACMKHFLGYSMPFTGKDRTAVYMGERHLREYFLPPFEAAIEAKALSVMINSGEINGLPVHASSKILTDLLRTELGFDGVAVTDWEDIIKLVHPHRVAPDLKTAVAMAINAGIDMSMVPNDYEFSDLLLELVNEGRVSESRIDEAVRRILKMKFRLDLFNAPFSPDHHPYPLVASDSFIDVSYNTAAEAITLLKNERQTLPLSTNSHVVVTGPMSNSLIMVNGAWTRTWQGDDDQWDDTSKLTLWEAIKALDPSARWTAGCQTDTAGNTAQDLKNIKASDYVIACMGEAPSTEKVGDINSLDLETAQIDYIKAVASKGARIILVLVENRPRVIREIEPLCDAIVLAYQPSENGTKAVADILYGNVNPSGKLPLTYPRFANDLLTYDHKYTDKLDPLFQEEAFNPQWTFGSGMSYTNYTYSNLQVHPRSCQITDSIEISFDVTNSGTMDGKETALVYFSDLVASVTPSVKRLRAFKKEALNSGETKRYSFKLTASELAFVNEALQWETESGEFLIQVEQLSDTLTLHD